VARVETSREFRGFGVAFVGRGQCRVLRRPDMPKGLGTWVVLEEPESLFPDPGPLPGSGRRLGPPPPRPSRWVWEAVNTTLSCGSLVLTGLAAAGSAAAAPVTAGGSLIITGVAYAGAAASAAQCGMAAARLINEVYDPRNNDLLDSNWWYHAAGTTLDAISLAGGAASLGRSANVALRLSRASGRPVTQVLRTWTRAERKRLAQDIARYAGVAPTRHEFIRLVRANRIPKLFTAWQIRRAANIELLNVASTALTYLDSANFGVIRELVLHLAEEK
jgi:hypothetical protein